MKRTDWQNAFGEVDEDFHLRLRSTLNGLEEKEMKKKRNLTLTLLAAALIVALVVVGVLKGQLKQAAFQSAAANYVREGSFHLDVKIDHFLYEQTERKKIEQPKKN